MNNPNKITIRGFYPLEISENYVFPVYIHQNVLDNIIKLAKSFENEIFGYLIGKAFKWKEITYGIIEDILFYLGALHSDKLSTAEIDSERYNKKFQRLKKREKNRDLKLLGWWHSHPGIGCFLSNTDIITQAGFPECYQVALVVDPIKDIFEFFVLDKQSKKGFKALSYAIIE